MIKYVFRLVSRTKQAAGNTKKFPMKKELNKKNIINASVQVSRQQRQKNIKRIDSK